MIIKNFSGDWRFYSVIKCQRSLWTLLAPNIRCTHHAEWCSKLQTTGIAVSLSWPLLCIPFKFWSAAHHTGHLIPAPGGKRESFFFESLCSWVQKLSYWLIYLTYFITECFPYSVAHFLSQWPAHDSYDLTVAVVVYLCLLFL